MGLGQDPTRGRENGHGNYFMINLSESMGLGQNQTRLPCICSQTHSGHIKLVKTDGYENIYNFMLKNCFYLNLYFSLDWPMYEYSFHKSMLPYEILHIRFIMIVELIQGYSYVNSFLSSESNITFLLFLHEITGTIDPQKLTLNAPIATKVVCFSRLLKCLRSLNGRQCGPRSDCSNRSSLFGVYTVYFYTEYVSNARQLFEADNFSRRHFQMHFFLGTLRVKSDLLYYFFLFFHKNICCGNMSISA